MAVNLINSNDIEVIQTDNDIQLGFGTTRKQQLSDLEDDIELLNSSLSPNIIVGNEIKLNYQYNGSDVYFKRVLIGSFPNATTITVSTGINNATLIKSQLYLDNGESYILLPYVSVSGTMANMINGSVKKDCSAITLTAGIDRSSLSGFADIYYIKIS